MEGANTGMQHSYSKFLFFSVSLIGNEFSSKQVFIYISINYSTVEFNEMHIVTDFLQIL